MAHESPRGTADAPRTGLLSRWLRKNGTVESEGSDPVTGVGLVTPPPQVEPSPAAPQAAPRAPELTWKILLKHCREALQADLVLAVDSEGLLLGSQGFYGRREVERVAAHLSRSFDYLDELTEIGSETESICAMYAGGRWLTAVRILSPMGNVVTIGVIGPFTLIQEGRQRLRNTFELLFKGAQHQRD